MSDNTNPFPDTPQPEGVEPPIIRGVPATWNPRHPIIDNFSHWTCPHCGAALAKVDGNEDRLICLNTCHLPDAMRDKFALMMRGMVAATKKEEGDRAVSRQ